MLGSHLITLAAAADGRREQAVQLLPAGGFSGRDGRGPWRLEDAAAVIEATRRYAGAVKMPVDYDHAIDLAAPKGQPAPAAGWLKGLQARADGIFGLVEWTARAAEMIRAKEYRYLSPVFQHDREGRIKRILRAALTNNPNLELTALAAAEGVPMDLSSELRQLLALPEDADEAAILASVGERVKAPAAVDPTQYVPIGELVKATAELARVNRGVTLQAASTTVDTAIHAGKLPPFLRDWAVNLCTVNKPAFDSFVENTAGGAATLFAALVPGVSPGGKENGRLTADEDSIARNLGLSADEFAAARGA